MATDFTQFNKRTTVMPGLNTDGMQFTKLRDHIGEELPVKGFFFTEGRFGKQVTIITDNCLVDMPARAVTVFELMAEDQGALEDIFAGRLIITDIKEVSGGYGTYVGYRFGNATT